MLLQPIEYLKYDAHAQWDTKGTKYVTILWKMKMVYKILMWRIFPGYFLLGSGGSWCINCWLWATVLILSHCKRILCKCRKNSLFLEWWIDILFSNFELQVFHQPKTFGHNALRRLPVEFCGNIYGIVSSAGYLCIVSLEICSKRLGGTLTPFSVNFGGTGKRKDIKGGTSYETVKIDKKFE